MPNRFIHTSFFKSPFVRALKAPLKTLYCFIICDCEGSGIWAKDLEIASFYVGQKITEDDFLAAFIHTKKAIDIGNGRFFFPDFIEHQYPKGLSETNPAHKNFIEELLKFNLLDSNLRPFKDPSKILPSIISNGSGKGKSNGKGKEEAENLIFPFTSEAFIKKWNTLITQPKWKKKTQSALQESLDKLAAHDEATAIEMMSNSIANNYQGVFPPKKFNNNGNNNTTGAASKTSFGPRTYQPEGTGGY